MKLRDVQFVLSATRPTHYPPADRPEIAFAGRSNVGKSSLMNTLFQRRQLARVSRTPGRTQLINFFSVNDAIYLVDLPGYGYAKVPTAVQREWGPMMERYVRSRETLCAMVVLFDVRRDPAQDDVTLMRALERLEVKLIPVVTKIDKLSRAQSNLRIRKIAERLEVPVRDVIAFSSHTRVGRDELWQVIADLCGVREDGRVDSQPEAATETVSKLSEQDHEGVAADGELPTKRDVDTPR